MSVELSDAPQSTRNPAALPERTQASFTHLTALPARSIPGGCGLNPRAYNAKPKAKSKREIYDQA
jgi:hypothetical protein